MQTKTSSDHGSSESPSVGEQDRASKFERCKASVYRGGFHRSSCLLKAVRDGFCGIHHPDAEAKRKENKAQRWKEKSAQWDRKAAQAKKNRERLEAYPRLVAELRAIASATPSKWDAEVRDQFQQWAQNRAAALLRELGELE